MVGGGDYVRNTRHGGGMVGRGGDYVRNTRHGGGMVGGGRLCT